jgi:4-alpha-glucanotransferase
VAYWEVPAGQKTALNGRWNPVPADDFFATLMKHFPNLSSRIIAEDLGIITDDVKEIMTRYHFRGMKVLLFAFNGDLKSHPYLPHNFTENCVVYTGTHDNNTVRGWFENEASEREKSNLFQYLKRRVSPDEVANELIRLALESSADIAIIPLQDILGLGKDARMNIPGTTRHNWRWRVTKSELDTINKKAMRDLVHTAGRSGQ